MTLEELEKRLKTLEDIEEIKSLQISYVNYLTYCQWDEIIELFTDNAEVELGARGLHKGKAEITKLFKEGVATAHIGRESNFVVHPVISVNGDKAKGTWLLYIMRADEVTGAASYWVDGPYNCEYVRENGKWKISYMKWVHHLGPIPRDLR